MLHNYTSSYGVRGDVSTVLSDEFTLLILLVVWKILIGGGGFSPKKSCQGFKDPSPKKYKKL